MPIIGFFFVDRCYRFKFSYAFGMVSYSYFNYILLLYQVISVYGVTMSILFSYYC